MFLQKGTQCAPALHQWHHPSNMLSYNISCETRMLCTQSHCGSRVARDLGSASRRRTRHQLAPRTGHSHNTPAKRLLTLNVPCMIEPSLHDVCCSHAPLFMSLTVTCAAQRHRVVAVASTSRRIVGHTTADERTAPPIRPCSAKSSHRCGGRPWHDTTAFLVNAKKPTSNSVPDSNLLPFAGWWSSTSRTPDPCRGPRLSPSATWDQTLLLWSIAARFGPSAPTRSGVQCCLHCS